MNVWVSIVVSLALVACAAALMAWHVRAWAAVRRQTCDRREFDYRRRQFRRRMQTSAMMAILAGLLGAAPFVGQFPRLAVAYTGAVLLLVLWICLLAAADAVATRLHFGRVRHDNLVERAKLQAQLRRIRAGGNGQFVSSSKQADEQQS